MSSGGKKTYSGAFERLEAAVSVAGGAVSGKAPRVRSAAAQPALAKSLASAVGSSANASSPLEAGYGTDSKKLSGGSAIRKQSLDKKRTVALVLKPTREQLLAKGLKALNDGRITGAEAMRYEFHVNLGRAVDGDLMAKVDGGQAK